MTHASNGYHHERAICCTFCRCCTFSNPAYVTQVSDVESLIEHVTPGATLSYVNPNSCFIFYLYIQQHFHLEGACTILKQSYIM